MPENDDITSLRRTGANGGWLSRRDRRDRGWDRPWEASPREKEREDVLSDFVGAERAPAVFASLRPGVMEAGKLVEVILGKVDFKSSELLSRIAANWENIVGKDNARQCRPAAIENGVLHIEVFSSAWLFVLNGQKILVSKRVAEFTSGKIGRVLFRQKGAFRR